MSHSLFSAFHVFKARRLGDTTTYEFFLTSKPNERTQRVKVDLAMNTSRARSGHIPWDAIQIDSGARDSATRPPLPASGVLTEDSFAGVIYLNLAERSIKAQRLGRLPAGFRKQGKPYEFQTVIYWPVPENRGRGGKRFYGLHAEVVKFRRRQALAVVYDAGTSQDGFQLPKITTWLALNDPDKGVDLNIENDGRTQIGGTGKRSAGAVFIERSQLKQMSGLRLVSPDFPVLFLGLWSPSGGATARLPPGKLPETLAEDLKRDRVP